MCVCGSKDKERKDERLLLLLLSLILEFVYANISLNERERVADRMALQKAMTKKPYNLSNLVKIIISTGDEVGQTERDLRKVK